MAKISKTKKDYKAVINLITLEHGLPDDALHFLRCNPAAQGNVMVLQALGYMDDCAADIEERMQDDWVKEVDTARLKGEEDCLEQFEVLLDAALYVRIAPNDADNIRDLLSEAAKCEKYRNNVRNN